MTHRQARRFECRECHEEQVSLRSCAVHYAHLGILEASLCSPPWRYHCTVKPPMAPLGHIADIPVVGPELYRVISP